MIRGEDFYKIMCAMVPLYTAMLAAYASVKWWRVFSPPQCAGIHRFVAVFAVPVLSFHFIADNNPYQMDIKFLLADALSKAIVLAVLIVFLPTLVTLDWFITLFSLSTLPNTLVMGIPLLQAMYGDFTQPLMVQLVVLQCIIWYTLLLFLFEYQAAMSLIRVGFPGGSAAEISDIRVDSDVVSLDSRDRTLRAESEIDGAGLLRVRIRRSSESAAVPSSTTASSLSGAEIFSIRTPSEFGLGPTSPGPSGSDVYSLQPTPLRDSNFIDTESSAAVAAVSPPVEGGHFGEKDLSFRDLLRSDQVEHGPQVSRTTSNQEMPRAPVILRPVLTVVGRRLSRNPNTYASVLGLAWSLISFKWNMRMPSLMKYSIKIISDAGLGMAMFSLGLFMALQPRIIACGTKMAMISMAIRFVVGPAVMCAASLAVGLQGVHLHAAIVQAGLPQGIVPFVFAREYGLHADILSTGVIFGMLVSLPVTLLYYILLGL